VSHVNVHEGCAREKIFGFGRDDRNPVVAQFSDVAGCGYTTDSISNDDYVHRLTFFIEGVPNLCKKLKIKE